jgi:acid stress-induced BolA-like protein IbaG/YrbA
LDAQRKREEGDRIVKTDEVHALSMKTYTPSEWAQQAR